MFSMDDEFVPEYVDKKALVDRLEQTCSCMNTHLCASQAHWFIVSSNTWLNDLWRAVYFEYVQIMQSIRWCRESGNWLWKPQPIQQGWGSCHGHNEFYQERRYKTLGWSVDVISCILSNCLSERKSWNCDFFNTALFLLLLVIGEA